MPKFRAFTPKKLIALLKKHGFVTDHITGGHYIMYNPESRITITVAYHGKDIPKGTLNAIIKASGLDVSLF